MASSNLRTKAPRQQELEKEIAELAKSETFYNPDRFKDVQISEYLQDFIKENPQSHTRVRFNRLLLEAAYPKEIARSKGGVYPDREIYTPTPEDSERCFQEYLAGRATALQANQLKPGEDVHVIDNRVQVSGQVAVMAINGLLTKVIFDHNPEERILRRGKFPAGLDVSTSDSLRRDYENQSAAAAGADRRNREAGPRILEAILLAADWRLDHLRHDR